ncbi:MAG: TatD family hydrolase [Cyclobacteriaceae bacterium]|nr:TatD family hydrolase [Cyclobacteriaceae bacterium]
MKLVETHAHIYLKEFANDLSEIIDRAKEGGVERIYMPNVDHTTIDDMLEVANKYPSYCVPMMGLHPCSVTKKFEKDLYEVEEYLEKGYFAAVGEIGTDLYWDKTFWPEQQEAFKIQAGFAKQFDLPLVIHCRETIDETIALVKEASNKSGIFHCFTGTLEQANEIIAQGFKIGLGGVATFKNGGLAPVIEGVDLQEIVVETDSPYLAPVPHRGKRNEPSYIKLVAEKIASIKAIAVEQVAEVTSQNTYKLFKNAKERI